MKIIKPLHITFVFTLLVSKNFAQSADQLQKEISSVESSLIPPVRFEGETAWDIHSRMAFYAIPSVSIAIIKDYKVRWIGLFLSWRLE